MGPALRPSPLSGWGNHLRHSFLGSNLRRRTRCDRAWIRWSICNYHDSDRGRFPSAPTTVHRGKSCGGIHGWNHNGAPVRWNHYFEDFVPIVFLSYYPGRRCVSACHLFHLQSPQIQSQDTKDQNHQQMSGLKRKILELDLPGNPVFALAVTCLLLALSWGGFVYPWNSGRIIVLLIFSAVLSLVFVATQISSPKTAMILEYILKNRNIASGVLYSARIAGAMTATAFYIPPWFQVVRGFSAPRNPGSTRCRWSSHQQYRPVSLVSASKR